ncbi:MAG: transporter substrate-binding domain-containing protein [Candidatus Sedimenticola sp. (ex Thyasira tokunagai)]
MTNLLKSLVITLILAAVAPAIQAAGEKGGKNLVVGVLADFPPQYVSTPEGKPGGFAVESFDLIAREAGLEYRYRLLNDWDAMLTSLRIGEVDVIPNLGITAERASDFAFSSVLEQFELGMFIRENDSSISNLTGVITESGV